MQLPASVYVFPLLVPYLVVKPLKEKTSTRRIAELIAVELLVHVQ